MRVRWFFQRTNVLSPAVDAEDYFGPESASLGRFAPVG